MPRPRSFLHPALLALGLPLAWSILPARAVAQDDPPPPDDRPHPRAEAPKSARDDGPPPPRRGEDRGPQAHRPRPDGDDGPPPPPGAVKSPARRVAAHDRARMKTACRPCRR